MGQPCSQASWNSHRKNVKITPALSNAQKDTGPRVFECLQREKPFIPTQEGHNQALFQVLQRKPQSFSSQHIKQALAKGGAFLPRLPCRFQSDHPFRPHLLFTQSYFFRKRIFPNILLTGPLGLCKFRDREDPATSFPPAGQALLLAPEDGQLELCNKTKGHNTPWGQVLKAFQRKMAPNRSSSPPICSSSAKDLLALAVN